MNNLELMQAQTAIGITLFYTSFVILVVFVSLAIFYMLLTILILETRLPGKRIFGFNCDMCDGKFRANGKPLFRCCVKKPVLMKLIEWRIIKPKRG